MESIGLVDDTISSSWWKDTSFKSVMAANRKHAQLQHASLAVNALRMVPQFVDTIPPAPGRWRYTWPAKTILNWVSVIIIARVE